MRLRSGIRSLGLDGIDFACHSPVLAIDLHAAGSGEVSGLLVPLTPEANLRTMSASYAKTTRLALTPESAIQGMATLAELDQCQQTK